MPLTNLNKRLNYADTRNYRNSKQKKSKKKMLIKIFIVLLILGALIYLPVRGIYQSAKQIKASAKATSVALQNENLDDIRKNLKGIKKSVDGMNISLNFLLWMKLIPYFGGFYSDAQHFSKAAGYEMEAANKIADSLEPYKDELGFDGQPTPGTDRVAQGVKVMNKVIPQLDSVVPLLEKASKEVSSVDVSKYPETFGSYRVRSQVDTAKNFIMGAHYAVTQARPALEVAPSAFGEPDAKNYLMIFQNDKELRATGGFMTAYAFLKLDKGRVSSSTSDDIYRLDEKLLGVCRNRVCPITPPAAIAKYLPEADGKPRTAWSMRDSNFSPDLQTSLKDFERMYNLLGNGEDFDGIIMIDTHVVEELIKITGPIEVLGTKYSAEHDDRCNCPNVIYELERYAQVIERGEPDRKAVLGTLMQQILARSIGASADKIPEFVNVGIKLANEKHIMFYMHDEKTQNALADLNWTGQIRQAEGDFLHINDSNFAGGKTNLYVVQSVLLEIDSKTGKHNLTIKYENPQTFNSWLNTINRDYVRVYVPSGSELLSSKGSTVKVNKLEEELGKTVFDAFIQVRPQNSITLQFEYETPYKASGKDYQLLIQRQPGTKDFPYEIKIDGKTKEKFELNRDKELRFSL